MENRVINKFVDLAGVISRQNVNILFVFYIRKERNQRRKNSVFRYNLDETEHGLKIKLFLITGHSQQEFETRNGFRTKIKSRALQ